MQKLKFVGVAGYATAGKDLFFTLLDKEYPSVRFSLGDILKHEIRSNLHEEMSIDILKCDEEEKEKARPFLVDYGKKKRKESEGRYFIDRLTAVINNTFTLSKIPVITDIRYTQYKNDEVSWLKEELDGVLVYIKKYSIVNNEREYVTPPNEDEAENDPKLRKEADYVIDWEEASGGFVERQRVLNHHIKKFVDWYGKIL